MTMARSNARMLSKRTALEWLFRLLTWVCIALLAVLSLTPGDYMVRTPAPGDVEHFIAYLGTGAVASLGYGRRVGGLVLGVLLCGYAGLLEMGQNWSPDRHPQLVDFASSAGGVISGLVLIGLWNGVQASREFRS
jgi:VanZ family protein